MNLQVITHNTGRTEIIRNYRKPDEKSVAGFKFTGKTRNEYQILIDKIYRVLNMHELYTLLHTDKNVTQITH